MLVHKAIVGAALGGLLTIVGLAVVLHVILGDGSFPGIQRLVVASALQVVVMLATMGAIARPGPGKPLTWVKAMAGAVTVAGLSLLVFGSVPHEWITFADSELQWNRRDLVMINLPALLPFDISRQAVRDMIEAGLYTNSFAAALAMLLMWQRRHEMADERARDREDRSGETAERELVPAGTSAYGRPLSKEA